MRTPKVSPETATRIAGLTYILIILIGITKVYFIESLIILPDKGNLANNISANEFIFRIGIAGEVLMYLLVIVLSLALYFILKPVHQSIAVSALFFRFGEAVIGCSLAILSGLIPLLILNNAGVFVEEQMQALLASFMDIRIAGLNIVLIFIGVGGTAFCYLFFKSWLVPRLLAAWGIITYASMFVLGFLNILFKGLPEMVETVLFGLGALFEVIFGFWLLIKGINISKWNTLSGHNEPKISDRI